MRAIKLVPGRIGSDLSPKLRCAQPGERFSLKAAEATPKGPFVLLTAKRPHRWSRIRRPTSAFGTPRRVGSRPKVWFPTAGACGQGGSPRRFAHNNTAEPVFGLCFWPACAACVLL